MVRLASISVPRIDLQLLALAHPDWKVLPAAVVTEEKPLGRITEVNQAGRCEGVLPGMRYAAALHICPQLRAAAVLPEDRDALRTRLTELLMRFSPEVERSPFDAALFWVDASGLGRLYSGHAEWAAEIERALAADGLVCSVAVGFTRFGTYVAAKAKRAVTILASAGEERTAALRAPVGVLPFDPDMLHRLHHLGIHTIRDLVGFSPGALRRRFGAEVETLRCFAEGDAPVPVQGVTIPQPLRRDMRLLHPEGSMDALVHHQVSMLGELVAQAWSAQLAITELVMEFCPERWPCDSSPGEDSPGEESPGLCERIVTALPTLDVRRIERLIRLRLERTSLPGPVVFLTLEVVCVAAGREQSDLFVAPRKLEYERARLALSDIAAELGNDAVQIAQLENSHLPEQQFSWKRPGAFIAPHPRSAAAAAAAVSLVPTAGGAAERPRLVRRMLHEPVPLSAVPKEFLSPRIAGPYELSGGWWQSPYQREYYYLHDRSGRLLWIYFDVGGQRWMVQGVVE